MGGPHALRGATLGRLVEAGEKSHSLPVTLAFRTGSGAAHRLRGGLRSAISALALPLRRKEPPHRPMNTALQDMLDAYQPKTPADPSPK